MGFWKFQQKISTTVLSIFAFSLPRPAPARCFARRPSLNPNPRQARGSPTEATAGRRYSMLRAPASPDHRRPTNDR